MTPEITLEMIHAHLNVILSDLWLVFSFFFFFVCAYWKERERERRANSRNVEPMNVEM